MLIVPPVLLNKKDADKAGIIYKLPPDKDCSRAAKKRCP